MGGAVFRCGGDVSFGPEEFHAVSEPHMANIGFFTILQHRRWWLAAKIIEDAIRAWLPSLW